MTGRVELLGWWEPSVARSVCADPRAVWLDAGSDATQGRSVLGFGDPSSDLVRWNADPEPTWAALAARLATCPQETGEEPTALGWHGWLSYEFGVRSLGVQAVSGSVPDVAMRWVDRAVVFDHARRRVRLEWLSAGPEPSTWIAQMHTAWKASAGATPDTAHAEACPAPDHGPDPDPDSAPSAVTSPGAPSMHWRHDAPTYVAQIRAAQAAITRGDAYQLCLTNTISMPGRFDPERCYRRLRAVNPSHHGGLLRFGDIALLSASPERFLEVTPEGLALTRPMKGTRPRAADPEQDQALAAELRASAKEQAENLMIVDLTRNDLAQVAAVGTVRVSELFAVEHYRHVHQLVSTVQARLAPMATAIDAVRACFPAGSMTGAPKRRAIELLATWEGGPRGVYSGCFGRLGADGTADLAMVIRSLVLDAAGATIGTGGGITALSDPAAELEETRIKAEALCAVLGVRADAKGVGRLAG